MTLINDAHTKTYILNEKLNHDISFTNFFDEKARDFLDIINLEFDLNDSYYIYSTYSKSERYAHSLQNIYI